MNLRDVLEIVDQLSKEELAELRAYLEPLEAQTAPADPVSEEERIHRLDEAARAIRDGFSNAEWVAVEQALNGKARASRNRTLTLSSSEISDLEQGLKTLHHPASLSDIENATLHQDLFECVDYLPDAFVDLMFIDPPYNLNRVFNSRQFRQTTEGAYAEWVESWIHKLTRILKPSASIYVCSDWKSSPVVYSVLSRYFHIRNRITWEREKGRGAKANWKNCLEDVWFATVSDEYTFNPDAVKLKRRVVAPYKDGQGNPKDWDEEEDGNYRLTHPSNLWTDLTVPFWSMPENTDHPTQKPEKLLAKVLLASSKPGDWVFDPFLGSGTTSVVARKLGRRFTGVEIDQTYCLLAEKRLLLADSDRTIQGYSEGVFWERNTLREQKAPRAGKSTKEEVDKRNLPRLF